MKNGFPQYEKWVMQKRNDIQQRLSESGGFLLIELIIVLVLIGITSLIVVSRIGNTGADLAAGTDMIKAHLRYAQAKAMSSNRVWGIRANGTGYSLFSFDGSAETLYRLPNEETNTVDLSGTGIGLGSFNAVSFDSWGSPYNNTTASGMSAGMSITVSSGGAGSKNITITEHTGFIP